MTIHATVTIIRQGDKILLQRKSSGRFGGGKWNGPGGKLQPNETPEECAAREVHEETGLAIANLRHHGALKHYFGDTDEPTWTVHQFSTSDYEGEPKESEEGELRWFHVDEIPYKEMWQDDEHWLPLLLQEKDFAGEFHFNENATQLLRHSLTVKE
ncbi:MAG: 8-oxo-dGTP diphosphatase [Candidatus Bathyarchaeota archaeon]|nr:MAG: 8-oxo-dGTP diphosphatase [Candidatus Bathyarchaeota archaeon]